MRALAARIVRVTFATLGLALVALVALVVGTLLHLGTPSGLRAVAWGVNEGTREVFRGRLEVRHIESFGTRGLRGLDARVLSPSGDTLAWVSGASARASLPAMVHGALFGDGPMVLSLDELIIDHVAVDVSAIEGPSKTTVLALADAFAMRVQTPSAPDGGPAPTVEIARIFVHHAWIYGRPTKTLAVDAELRNLEAAFRRDSNALDVRLFGTELLARQVLGTALTARTTAALVLPTNADLLAHATATGTLAGVPLAAEASLLEGGRFEARAAIPVTDGRALAVVLPQLPLQGPVALRAEAKGRLEGPAELDAKIRIGAGAIAAHVDAILGKDLHAQVAVEAKRIEIVSFSAKAPPSLLGLSAVARLHAPADGAPTGVVHATLADGSQIADQVLPPIRIDASLDAAGRLVADLLAAEPGARTSAHAELPKGAPLTFATATEVDLAALARAARPGRGTASVATHGTLDLATLALDARAHVDARALEVGSVRLAGLGADVTARGNASSPSLHAELQGTRLRVGKTQILRRFEASTDLSVDDGLTFRASRISAQSRGERLDISAPVVSVRGDEAHVHGARIEGLGSPIVADATRRGGHLAAHVRADDLDLGRLGRLVEEPALSGRVSLNVDLHLDDREVEGDVRVSIRDATLPTLPHVRASIDASLHSRQGRLDLDVDLGGALQARARLEHLTLHGPALSIDSWKRAEGHGYVFADADLARLGDSVPALTTLPFRLVGGRAKVQGGILHDPSGLLPSVDVAVSTRGLVLAARTEASKPASVALRGMDVAAEARIDGTVGATALSARLLDARGVLVFLDAKGEIPIEALLAGASLDDLKATWLTRPMGLRVTARERNLTDLAFLSDLGLTGRASFDFSLEGTPNAPRLRLDLSGTNLKPRGSNLASSLEAACRYDGKTANVDATWTAKEGNARIEARAVADVAHLLAGKAVGAWPWKADATATFVHFPLALVPTAREIRVRGALDGKVSLVDLHNDAKLDVSVDATSVTVAQAPIPHIRIRASVRDGLAEGHVRVEQTDGYAELVGSAGLAWAAELVPKIDPSRPLAARFDAKAFRAAVLSPFTTNVLADLDGRIDGSAKVRADADGKNVHAEGTIVAKDFSFVLSAVGQEYRDVGATVRFMPSGVLRIDDVHASDGSGKVTGAAVARFDNLAFVAANGLLRIPKASSIDLVTEGQSLGEVYGDVSMSVRNIRATKTLDVQVDLPSLHLKLLESAGRQVQELKARPDVRVGFVRGGILVPLALVTKKPVVEETETSKDTSTIAIAVRLGRDVEVRRGAQVAVQLTGTPVVHISGGRTNVTGQLQLTGGAIDLSGRKFIVDKGTVTFGQDPKNPVVVATATWTAADKSRVFADFVGPIRTGKLTLRSEPARTQSEILTLIAFGTTDGPSDAPTNRGKAPSQGTQVATTLGGGALTEGFDSALDGLTGIRTQTRIDATNANNPRPELEVQVSRDISLRFAYVLGTPPPSEPDKSLGTVIFRFAPNWSLSTTVGDKGKATIDTMWQYRY